MPDLDSLTALLQSRFIATDTLRVFHTASSTTMYALSAPGQNAIALWQQLRALTSETGYWPIVMGNDEDAAHILENISCQPQTDVSTILAEAEQINPIQWMQRRITDLLEDISADEEDEDEDAYSEEKQAHDYLSSARFLNSERLNVSTFAKEQYSLPLDGLEALDSVRVSAFSFEDEALHDAFHLPANYRREWHPSVHIALVPTTEGWQVPAYLFWGGWNECPHPAEHVSLFKYWNYRHGAEVVGMSGDVIEMFVPTPPQDKIAALHLAYQQYTYCYDIVSQGTQSVQNLADELLQRPVWFFWWD